MIVQEETCTSSVGSAYVWDEDGQLRASCWCVDFFLGKLVSVKMAAEWSEGSVLSLARQGMNNTP